MTPKCFLDISYVVVGQSDIQMIQIFLKIHIQMFQLYRK